MNKNNSEITTLIAHHSYNFDKLRFEHYIRNYKSVSSHWHEFYEITFVIASGESIVTNQCTSFDNAAIIFCTPADIHSLSYNTPSHENYIISFSDVIISEVVRTLMSDASGITIPISKKDIPFWLELFSIFENTYSKSKTNYRLTALNILEFLILQIINSPLQVKKHSTENSKGIQCAISYIQKNFMKNITLKDLSEITYLSESYISYLFHKETGKSFSQYVNDIRLEKASHMLLYTGNSIADIAAYSGFNTTKHFQRCFKNKYGISPLKYRLSNQSAN